MKFPTPALALYGALCLALPGATNARADEKTDFLQSLAVPLSRAETRQYDALFLAQKTATAAFEIPGSGDTATKNYLASNEAFVKFVESKSARMPLEIRRTQSTGATSLYLGRHQIGAGPGKPMLVHVWTVRRRSDGSNSHLEFGPSPFHLDVFRAARGKGTQRWQRIATRVYEEEGGEISEVEAHYLRQSTKQSPVLVLYTGAGMSTTIRVVTFAGGIGQKGQSFAQPFSAFGSGGGAVRVTFGTDARGIMTVIVTSSYNGRVQKATIYAWNGHEFVPRSAAK